MPYAPLHLFASLEPDAELESSWSGGAGDRARVFELDTYRDFARIAHRGVFDGIFRADRPELIVDAAERPLSEQTPEYPLEPVTLFTALAHEVPDIAFIVTATTSFNLPYALARQLQSAQILSGGRIIWNVVATFRPQVAQNFGAALAGHDDRYRRAEEFVELVRRLWASWRFDWAASDTPTAEPFGRTEVLDFEGEFYRSRGPLNVPLPSFGPPVICQAGGSPQGRRLAAKYAEIVLGGGGTKTYSQAYRRELSQGLVDAGRDPRDIRLLSPVSPVIHSTEAEVARASADLRDQRGSLDDALTRLEKTLAVELRHIDLDAPLAPRELVGHPDEGWPAGVKNRIISVAVENKYSLRQLAEHDGTLIGTPEQVADHLQAWWQDDATDGFYVGGDLSRFVDTVVPVLQRRGVSATEYGGRSFRERLGVSDWSARVPERAVGGR